MLAKDFYPPKKAIKVPYNWAELKWGGRERERNQDRTNIPEREL